MPSPLNSVHSSSYFCNICFFCTIVVFYSYVRSSTFKIRIVQCYSKFHFIIITCCEICCVNFQLQFCIVYFFVGFQFFNCIVARTNYFRCCFRSTPFAANAVAGTNDVTIAAAITMEINFLWLSFLLFVFHVVFSFHNYTTNCIFPCTISLPSASVRKRYRRNFRRSPTLEVRWLHWCCLRLRRNDTEKATFRMQIYYIYATFILQAIF